MVLVRVDLRKVRSAMRDCACYHTSEALHLVSKPLKIRVNSIGEALLKSKRHGNEWTINMEK